MTGGRDQLREPAIACQLWGITRNAGTVVARADEKLCGAPLRQPGPPSDRLPLAAANVLPSMKAKRRLRGPPARAPCILPRVPLKRCPW
jgi:hypothetical protein